MSSVEDLVGCLDRVAGAPSGPGPVVVVASDDSAVASRFIENLRTRLTTERGSLVPHAYVGGVAAPAAEGHQGDVAALEQVGGQLHASMPRGTGTWNLTAFDTCVDVMRFDRGNYPQVDQPRRLRDHLYEAHAARVTWASWIRGIAADAPTVLGPVVQWLINACVLGPNRWWYGRRLKGRRWSWLGERGGEITGQNRSFFENALLLTQTGSPLRGETFETFRRRVLVEAIVRDARRLASHRRFLPRWRRRRFTPVILFDCVGARRAGAELVRAFSEPAKIGLTSPLLIVAAMEPDNAIVGPHGDAPCVSVSEAAELLARHSHQSASARPASFWLPVQLPVGPLDPVARAWLETHRYVRPPQMSSARAWMPVSAAVAAAVALTATVAGPLVHHPDKTRAAAGRCAQTAVEPDGERVGVTDGTCPFDPTDHILTGLEQLVVTQNAAVDKLRDPQDPTEPIDYRTVVFFAPLTHPADVAGQTTVNGIAQLRGTLEEQKDIIHRADLEATNSVVPIKILLANSGNQFAYGTTVAATINRQKPMDGRGSIAAVVGISQSRAAARTAIAALPNFAVVGASVNGNRMPENLRNFFMVSPPDSAMATAMTRYLVTNLGVHRAVIVYDPTDTYYSNDLYGYLRTQFGKQIILDDEDDLASVDGIAMSEGRGTTTPGDLGNTICTRYVEDHVVPVFAGRADQLISLVADMSNSDECTHHLIPMVAGPGAVVAVASGTIPRYSWLSLHYTALSDSAEDSDEATGKDALAVASQATNWARDVANDDPYGPRTVLHQMETSTLRIPGPATGLFTIESGNSYDPSPDRVRICTMWASSACATPGKIDLRE